MSASERNTTRFGIAAAIALLLATTASLRAADSQAPPPTPAAPAQTQVDAVAAMRAAHEALGPPAFIGRVIDAGGNPIAGARVVAAARTQLDTRHGRRSLLAPCMRELCVETGTDADGGFRIADPERALGPSPDGLFELELRAPGFATLALQRVALPGAGALDLGQLVLEGGRRLTGIVRDRDGAVVHDALVALAPVEHEAPGAISTALPLATTRTDGTFEASDLPPGTWTLVVASPEHPEMRFEAIVSDAAELAPLELELPRAESITGHLLSEPELGFADIVVHALPLERMTFAADHPVPVTEILGARVVRVAEDGRFELRGLDPNLVYALRALASRADPSHLDAWAGSALLRAPARDVRLVLRRDAALELLVVDGQGDPIEDFVVHVAGALPERVPPELPPHLARARGAEGAAHGAAGTAHHPDGRARLVGLRPTSTDEVHLSVEAPAHAPWHSEAYVLLPGGAFQVGRVMLARRPTLAVRVLDQDGEDVAGAVARLASDDPALALVEAVTNHEGRALVRDERAAPRRLGVVAPGFAPRLVHDPFVQHDETELVVTLEPESAVAVSVVRHDGTPAVGVPVEHSALDPRADAALAPDVAGHAIVRSDTRGVALFLGLGAGEHAFELVRRGRREAHERGTVRVGRAALETLSLTADFETRVRGVALDEGRPLPGGVLTWRWSGTPRAELTITADDRGRFEIGALEHGSWRVELSHSGDPRPVELAVVLERGAQDLVLDAAATRTTWLQVAHADGTSAAGAEVFLRERADGELEIDEGTNVFALAASRAPDTVADAHGLFALDLSDASHVVVLQRATHASAVLELPLTENGATTLVLQPPASLTLEREHWPPADDRALVLVPERGFPALPARIVFPYRGDELQLRGLAPGTWAAWIVTLDALGRARELVPVATIDLVAGRRTRGALPR